MSSPAEKDFDVCVIGAGVVGCAIAAEVQSLGLSVVVLDVNDKQGQGTTSRNSEVIHAGIYYAEGSKKAKFCIEGRESIYALSKDCGIPTRQSGKFVVATNAEQIFHLERLYQQALRNGVEGVRRVTGEYIRKAEPLVFAIEGIEVAVSGIVSAHALCDYFHNRASDAGASFAFRTGVTEIHQDSNGWTVVTDTVVGRPQRNSAPTELSGPPMELSGSPYRTSVKVLINSAGLYADWIAQLAGINIDEFDYRLRWLKGEYFSLPSSWVRKLKRLIYPLPLENLKSVGIHCTLDLGSQARLGPSALYVPRVEDYSINNDNRHEFFSSVRDYIPSLKEEDLTPQYCGIRPKLSAEGQPARDFVIEDETAKGFPGLINLIGIDSPGLTSSPAIGRYVRGLVERII